MIPLFSCTVDRLVCYNGLTWTPDSDGIAFVRDEGIHFDEETQTYEEMQIYLANTDNLDEHRSEEELVNLTSNVHICDVGEVYHNPDWAGASNQLAVAVSCGGGGDDMEIYQMDMLGEGSIVDPTLMNLTQGELDAQAGFRGISWDDSGTRLGFVAIVDDETPSSEIFVIDIVSNDIGSEYLITQLTDSPTRTSFLSIDWIPTIIGN